MYVHMYIQPHLFHQFLQQFQKQNYIRLEINQGTRGNMEASGIPNRQTVYNEADVQTGRQTHRNNDEWHCGGGYSEQQLSVILDLNGR